MIARATGRGELGERSCASAIAAVAAEHTPSVTARSCAPPAHRESVIVTAVESFGTRIIHHALACAHSTVA
jgi:hypothetical protein